MPSRREERSTNVRHAIMQAVLDIVHREGWSALTIRRIADRIRYSPPMIYEHFANKEAIYQELSVEGFRLLYRYMITRAAGLSKPHQRLNALIRAIRLFAWENPTSYQAMFGLATGTADLAGQAEYAVACRGLIGDALLQLAEAGELRPLPPLEAAAALMAALHGVIALHLAGVTPDRPRAEAQFDLVLEGILAGWRP